MIMKRWLSRRRGGSDGGTVGHGNEFSRRRNGRYRLARLESLESRELLSVTSLSMIGNTSSIIAGSPGWIGVDGVATEGESLSCSVSIDTSALTSGSLSYELMTGDETGV